MIWRDREQTKEEAKKLDRMPIVFSSSTLITSSRPLQTKTQPRLLNSPARLPGGPLSNAASNNLGWHALTGQLDEFDVGSYLGPGAGVPGQESEEMPVDLHSRAEALFKLGTKPATRAT